MKDHTIYDTVTITKTETALRCVYDGDTVVYLRRGSANTISFDNDYTVFNADKTGNTVDFAGFSHFISTWNLVTTDKTTLKFTIENISGVTTVVTWDNIRYKDKNINYDDHYTNSYTG